MEAHFTWKAKLFRNKYDIFRNDTLAGEMKDKNWSRTSLGELNTRKITFETRGIFRTETKILDTVSETELGIISYNIWKTKATITFNNKEYTFQYDNLFHTKWSISNENGPLVKYQSTISNGIIDSYTDDEVLILAGFYIRHFFQQNAASSAAAAT